MSKLDPYLSKRNFKRTPEPVGMPADDNAIHADAGGIFVIHKHAARRLHYDLRLEHGGVLLSWAVTRGPSLDPDEKRLAVQVEDHPLDYATFEGNIPKGGYGAGTAIVWDQGTWLPEGDAEFGLEKGHLSFALKGEKLGGQWHLVRLKPRIGEKRMNWLLMKVKDHFARSDLDVLEAEPYSVQSGLHIEEVARGVPPTSAAATTMTTRNPPRPAHPMKAAALGQIRGSEPLPTFVSPCLATLQTKPPAGERWLHEVKFDGYRLQARVDHGVVRLSTRTGLDWTPRFGPAIASACAMLPCRTALIDGEAVVLGDDGIASFSALQNALSENHTDAIVYYAFDLLHLDGVDLTPRPLTERKDALSALFAEVPNDGVLRFSEHFEVAGETMLKHSCRMGLEGVISKRSDRPYRSGRGTDWLKSKCTQRQEFVIGGYLPSKGFGNSVGSLVMGYYENGVLKHAGRVGTGFTTKAATDLKARLAAIAVATSPFDGRAPDERNVVWVSPELVAEIEFRAWTASRTLRHASFLELREDKPASEVAAEFPESSVTGNDSSSPIAEPMTADAAATRIPAETDVKLTNPDKVLWPDCGFTKRNLLDYYATVWPLMAGFIVNRPLSLLRAPDGIDAHQFFQKHASPGMHRAVLTQKDKDGEELMSIRDFDGLAALVQLGTVEIHLWGSTISSVESPDQVIFDLDPDESVPLDRVRDAAVAVRDRLAYLGFESWLKTSGGKGLHVVMPIKPKADWQHVKSFAHDFAKAFQQTEPDRYTATLSKAARKGRIFIDYLRNARGATAIAPYSTRARKGAAVSMPVSWDAIGEELMPDQFRAASILASGLNEQLFRAQTLALRSGQIPL